MPVKKMTFFLMFFFMVLLLVSCNGNGMSFPYDSSELPYTEPRPSTDSPEQVVTLTPAETSLETLRRDAADYLCAAAYIGYDEENNIHTVTQCVEESVYAADFPFLTEILPEHFVFAGGCDVYCIVPVDPSARVTVHRMDYDMDGDGIIEIPGDMLYSGSNEPIILVCNVSDIMPNSLVTIQTDKQQVSFFPYISLENGALAIGAPGNESMPERTLYNFGDM